MANANLLCQSAERGVRRLFRMEASDVWRGLWITPPAILLYHASPCLSRYQSNTVLGELLHRIQDVRYGDRPVTVKIEQNIVIRVAHTRPEALVHSEDVDNADQPVARNIRAGLNRCAL